jgi:mono/diheme cytochrome c family protein
MLGACEAGAPADPTYFGDVQSILAANCARCHGADPTADSIAGFRLDRYVKNDDATLDAWDFRDSIVTSAVELEDPVMPPRSVLSERQRETLARWVQDGAPKGVRDNNSPMAVLIEPAGDPLEVDQSLDITLRAWDDDGDGIAVALAVRTDSASPGEILAAGLGGGMRSLQLDTGALGSGQSFELYAIVDDGYADDPAANATEITLIADLFVDHGTLGTAPTVQLLEPNGGTTILGTTEIAWLASDPDAGDTLTIDLDLVRVHADASETVVERLAEGLANEPSTWQWDPTDVATEEGGVPIDYVVRVTVSDGQNTRSDQSDDTFTLATGGGETGLTWADVLPFFDTYCNECHAQPSKTAALEYFRLDKYDAADPAAPANDDLGAFEVRDLVYDRTIVKANMPPNNKPQPSAAEIADVAEWILAGAPP